MAVISVFYFSGDVKGSPRNELLHNIDPLSDPLGELIYKDTWDARMMAALRVGNWKILTGDPGKKFNSKYIQ